MKLAEGVFELSSKKKKKKDKNKQPLKFLLEIKTVHRGQFL